MVETALAEEVRIRDMEKRHAQAFLDFVERGRERFLPWIPFVGRTKGLADIEDLVRRFQEKRARGEGFMWGLWREGRVVGMLMIRELDEGARWAEIGYMLDASIEGQGLAAASCRRMIRFIFEELDLERVLICCDARNGRSIALAERLGFSREGTLRRHIRVGGVSGDLVQFGLLRDEWKDGARKRKGAA